MICLSYLARASICFPFRGKLRLFCVNPDYPTIGVVCEKYDRRSIMHDEQQRQPAQQPDARTQQVLNRVRHIINKRIPSLSSTTSTTALRRCPCTCGTAWRISAIRRAGGGHRRRFPGIPLRLVAKGAAQRL